MLEIDQDMCAQWVDTMEQLYNADGEPSAEYRHLSYQPYNLSRHHNGQLAPRARGDRP